MDRHRSHCANGRKKRKSTEEDRTSRRLSKLNVLYSKTATSL
ncbi:hypothetical protein GCK32_021407, partial [Trichostrongylus colubriformis]